MYKYTDEQLASIKKVEATRSERLNNLFPRMTADEKDERAARAQGAPPPA